MTPPANIEPTVLVAEGENQLREAQLDMLRELGYQDLYTAATGTEAWEILKTHQIDLVLAGWTMPEMSGMALLKVIRADVNLSEVPLILVTTEVTKGQVIEAGESGVTDLICLPLTPHTIQRKIDNAVLAGRDPAAVEAERHYQQGIKLMEDKRYDESLVHFKRVLTIFENAEVYYNMGYISTARGDYESAIRYFRKATQINNAFARAHQKMGEVYVKLGRKKRAQKAFQKSAALYMEKHMDENAEAVLQEVLKINPDTINVFNSLGIIYRRRGEYQRAMDQYQKALKVDPEDENILYNIGRLYYDMEQFVEAREALSRALEINPDFRESEGLIRNIDLRLKSAH